jgi:hypothetical protein
MMYRVEYVDTIVRRAHTWTGTSQSILEYFVRPASGLVGFEISWRGQYLRMGRTRESQDEARFESGMSPVCMYILFSHYMGIVPIQIDTCT